MRRSTDRILTTHVGSLVRPPGLIELMRTRDGGQPYNQQELDNRVRSSIAEVVKHQLEVVGWGSKIRGVFQIIQVKTLIAIVH